MNAPFKTPETEAPLWDLSDLYGSRDDARLAADMTQARALVDDLNGLQGRLAAQRADPSALGATLDRAITLYEQASDRLGAMGAYAFLAASTARDDAGAQGFEADVREKITAIATPCTSPHFSSRCPMSKHCPRTAAAAQTSQGTPVADGNARRLAATPSHLLTASAFLPSLPLV